MEEQERARAILEEATRNAEAASVSAREAVASVEALLDEHKTQANKTTEIQKDTLKAVLDAAKAAQGAARTAQASSWAAQKDATRAARASARAMQISDHVTEEVEDWDGDEEDESEHEKSAWDQLSLPATEGSSEEEGFWAKVPEHLGDGSLLDDPEDDRWIDKLKKKLPAAKEADADETKAEKS
jgi:hypothetical protein